MNLLGFTLAVLLVAAVAALFMIWSGILEGTARPAAVALAWLGIAGLIFASYRIER